MEDPKKYRGPTWTAAQCSGVEAIERKYNGRRELAGAQGLKSEPGELLEMELREVRAVLTASQFSKYRRARTEG